MLSVGDDKLPLSEAYQAGLAKPVAFLLLPLTRVSFTAFYHIKNYI
jgi:hypothetical protein